MASKEKTQPGSRKKAKTAESAKESAAVVQQQAQVEEKQQQQTLPVIPNATPDASSKPKFTQLANRFTGFEQELYLQRQKKKSDEQKQITDLQNNLSTVQTSLALESKNRSQSIQALQAWLTDRIEQWTQAIEKPMLTKLDTLHKRIDTVADKIEQVDKKYASDRDVFPKLVDQRCAELLNEIRDLKKQFEADRAARDEREKRVLVKIQDLGTKLSADFAAEKSLNEQKFTAVRQDISEETQARVKSDEILRQKIDEAVAPFPGEIAKESKERAKADQELEAALNHYTAALQDSIKIISSH